MASIADIANNFRQGLVSPISSFTAGKAQFDQGQRQNRLLELQEASGQREQDKVDLESSNRELETLAFGVQAADTPEKFAAGQAAGQIPSSLTFDQKDDFVFKAITQTRGPEVANKILGPQSSAGKRQEDVRRGLLTQAQADKSGSGVTVNIAGDKKFDEENAKAISAGIDSLTELGRQSVATLDNLNKMESLLDDIETGPFENTKFAVQQKAAAIGLDFKDSDFSSKEQFQAAAAKQVLDIMATQKGPQTEGDRAFIALTQPGLGKSRTSNSQMIDFAKSRQTLNRFFAGEMRQLRTIRNVDEAITQFNEAQALFEQTPAALVIDGKGVTFNKFAEAGRKAGMNMDEIVDNWLEVAQ